MEAGAAIEELARDHLGFERLRPGQLRAVRAGTVTMTTGPGETARAEVPFSVGARVASERWGEGTVQRYDGDQVTVLFDEHGYREMFVPLVLERGLLKPA